LLAEPLYLTGYIERLGTGIPDMLDLSQKAGGVKIHFNEAPLRALLKDGFGGLEPFVIKVTSVASPLSLLGVRN